MKVLELHGSMFLLFDLEILDTGRGQEVAWGEGDLPCHLTQQQLLPETRGDQCQLSCWEQCIPGYHNQKCLKTTPGDSTAQSSLGKYS